MFRENTVENKKMCDILVEVENAMQFKTFDLKKVDVIFEMGYQAMKNAIEVNSL